MKTIFTILLLSITTFIYPQQDSTKTKSDKVYLNEGSSMIGKVVTIKKDDVVFLEDETNLSYELSKTEIKFIMLSSGKTLTFKNNKNSSEDKTQENEKNNNQEKDSGTSPGLIVLAAIGGVLALLLIIGAIASSGK